jgi:GT2 family glycosyltransferase
MVTILIVHWNNLPALRECLIALRGQTLRDHRVIVIDNSPSGEANVLGGDFPEADIFAPGYNAGFAAGNNLGLARTRTDLVATLNPDAVPESRWLEALVKAARENPDTAAFGSLQLMKEDRNIIDGAGDCYHVSGLFWRAAHGKPLPTTKIAAQEIFSPCAAAALYRRDAVEKVGGFDDQFFCYGEDVDLGFRLRLAGYGCRLVPQAVVLHEGGASSGGGRSDFAAYHGHRNMVWVYAKNMPGMLFWLLLPLHVLANLASAIVLVLRGQPDIAWRAKRDAIKGWPAMWRKRSARHHQIGPIWRAMGKAWK